MVSNSQIRILRDVKAKQITVIRNFDAPLENVWRAWTESDLLDQWWAPRPWRAETKTIDFREGGHWVYAMVGPDDSKQWCRVDYFKIAPNQFFEGTDYFLHENGTRNNELPGMHWHVQFNESGSGTEVKVLITFDSEEDLQRIVEMGFEVGFTAALENLDQYLKEN